ncbi:MAG: hypothetical protein JWO51_405 [Rhodospirillales bacterium]|nr:hypothetical protein [Rhodospirillales bacterium]
MDRLIRRLVLIIAVAALGTAAPNAPARAAEGGGAPADGPVFVKIPSVSFTVIGANNKIQKEVQILINLELEPGKIEAALDPFKRRLQDAFLVTCSEMWDSRAIDAPAIQGDEIKSKLLKVTTDIVGPGTVKSVLLLGIGERSHGR